MNPENAIEVRHVSKKFARSLKRSMLYGVIDIGRMALMPKRYRSQDLDVRLADAARDSMASDSSNIESGDRDTIDGISLRPSEFWALRDVSMSIRKGECVGIVGHNGAGKSTLFSIISGIYGPTCGEIQIRGRLQALIALGAGFHPALTGRENIYVNASILGLTRREIDQRFDRIVEFSELQAFLDSPVKNFSSGMLVRLGFSVAAHLDPDILLIDEVLAVGDMSFQRKCLNRLRELLDRRVTVVMVSHVLHSIESICSRAYWMDHGRVFGQGEVRQVLRDYVNAQIQKSADIEAQRNPGVESSGPGEHLVIEKLEIRRMNGEPTTVLDIGESFVLRMNYITTQRVDQPYFHLVFFSGTVRVFDASMLIDGEAPDHLEGQGVLECIIKNPNLMPNAYRIHAHVRTKEATVDAVAKMKSHTFIVQAAVDDASAAPSAVSIQSQAGLVRIPYQWNWVKE